MCTQEHLEALQRKLEFAEHSETAQESAAFRDVAPELERLRAKAVAKAHEILMARCAPQRDQQLAAAQSALRACRGQAMLGLQDLCAAQAQDQHPDPAAERAAEAEALGGLSAGAWPGGVRRGARGVR